MTSTKLVSFLVAASLTTTLAACSGAPEMAQGDLESTASSYGTAINVCFASDLFSEKKFTQYGNSESEARAKAMKECREKTGNACTATCMDNEIDTLMLNEGSNSWSCVVEDFHTGRVWARIGSTAQEARRNAEKYCSGTKAGTECVVTKCSPVG